MRILRVLSAISLVAAIVYILKQRQDAGGRGRPTTGPEALVLLRVQSKIKRLASNPDSIQVVVRGERVILSGLAPAHEVEQLCAGVRRVIGVEEVENLLEVDVVRARSARTASLPPDWMPGTGASPHSMPTA